MSEPIVFVSRNRVKEGKLDQVGPVYREAAEYIKDRKPGTLAHLGFLNAEGTELTIVHIFRDAEAMESHMEAAAEAAKKGFQVIESLRLEVYGKPTDTVLERMKRIAGSGVALSVNPQPVGGYIRLESD